MLLETYTGKFAYTLVLCVVNLVGIRLELTTLLGEEVERVGIVEYIVKPAAVYLSRLVA